MIKRGMHKVDMLVRIFLLFMKISMFSFGGGYVAFPIICQANEANNWMSTGELSNILSLAGMSPGPVAINAAVGVGYNVAGVSGVIAAFLGIALPCAIIVTVVASFFFKVYKHPLVKDILYILRAVITGIILYAGISFALKNGIVLPGVFENSGELINGGWNLNISSINLFEIKSIIIAAATFMLLLKTKIHPILIIIGGGITGLLIF
jgi:chromate transporter